MDEKKVVIRVDHVSKSFKLFLDKGVYLKEKLLFKNRRRFEERKVLKDISFEVHQGEAIGLIGENGCGKSTTLKLLSQIMYPDKGTITMNGRVSALIELGAGFHPDMSGRENIYTNAAIFGLTKEEIDKRLQTIIDFSELGAYIDNPVRTYSSGMYMRLAFSVAINVDADILLIDEILAVGDVAFQAKCFNKLREIKRKGTTIVIVSHALGSIEQFCDRSYWIDNGVIREEGYPIDVHQKYLRFMSDHDGTLSEHNSQIEDISKDSLSESDYNDGIIKTDLPSEEKEPREEENGTSFEINSEGQNTSQSDNSQPSINNELRWGSKEILFTSIALEDYDGKKKTKLESGKPFRIKMRYTINHQVEDAVFGIGIFRNDGLRCYGTNTEIDRISVDLTRKEGMISFDVLENNLLPGEYFLDVAVHRHDGFPYDYCKEYLSFTVFSIIQDVGIMRLSHEWNIRGE